MFLLFDIGGTNSKYALSDGKSILHYVIMPTSKVFKTGVEDIQRIFLEFSKKGQISAAIGGVASPLSKDKSILLNTKHLKDWSFKPLKKVLTDLLRIPVFIENDTDLEGLGEAVYGIGKDFNIVAYIGFATGVGGTRIVNKTIDINSVGFEPGKQVMNFDANTYTTLEDLAAGGSIIEKYGVNAGRVMDPSFKPNLEKLIAYSLNNTAVYWSPDIIIIGGGVVNHRDLSLENIGDTFYNTLQVFQEKPKVALATLGDQSGIYGALALTGKLIKK